MANQDTTYATVTMSLREMRHAKAALVRYHETLVRYEGQLRDYRAEASAAGDEARVKSLNDQIDRVVRGQADNRKLRQALVDAFAPGGQSPFVQR